MKKQLISLFLLRLFFYFSVITLIFLHPGISVPFDHIGIMQWFIINPLMAVIAFQQVFRIDSCKRFLFVLALLLPLSIIAGGFNLGAFSPFFSGLASFILTFLLFHHNRMMLHLQLAKVAVLEPFILAWICLRLLSLSRSGEEIAGQSAALTQFILVWTFVVFLLHSAVVYFCLNPKSYVKTWKEGIIFILGTLAVLVILIAVLPPDFVRNTIIENLIPERVPERISTSDRGLPQRTGGRRTLPQGESGQGELRGVSEHNWPSRGENDGESRQYMVKIVASAIEPVYMGESFNGHLDPVHGFLLSREEPVNDLARQRFFVTWSGNERNFDLGRKRHEIFSLSTLRQKYLPYLPVSIDPTILNENSGPLRFIHQVESNIHSGDPLFLVNTPTRSFTERERTALASYLDLPLNNDDKKAFNDFLNNALENWHNNREEIIKRDRYLQQVIVKTDEIIFNQYLETIIAILVSFSVYQYNLNYDDDYSIAALKDFLFNTKEGNCVEFSNTLALLGRLAGIPSRVVTGYLVSESLQTPAHLRGLSVLQRQIPVLQKFSFDNLFMITNLHSHSWTQFFIPDYGWLDFEATSFAIPPLGIGDFNNWDVVIPLIDENRTFSQVRKFPWQAVGRAAVTLIIFALICAYILRYGRELVLFICIQRDGSYRVRARYLYLLLLARLAADGQPIKPASKTAHEYSELFPGNLTRRDTERENEEGACFKAFADIYSAIRWREFSNEAEINEHFQLLKQEYFNILKNTRRRGIHRWFIRKISLRGLTYL